MIDVVLLAVLAEGGDDVHKAMADVVKKVSVNGFCSETIVIEHYRSSNFCCPWCNSCGYCAEWSGTEGYRRCGGYNFLCDCNRV